MVRGSHTSSCAHVIQTQATRTRHSSIIFPCCHGDDDVLHNLHVLSWKGSVSDWPCYNNGCNLYSWCSSEERSPFGCFHEDGETTQNASK